MPCGDRAAGRSSRLRPRLHGGAAQARGSTRFVVSKQTRTIVLTIIATLVAVAVLQNMRSVTVRFVLWDAAVPLSLFLLFVCGLGFLAGLFWRRR